MNIDQLFADEITEEIKKLVRKRLLVGGNLAPRGCDRRKAKLALLLVLEINPKEVLTREEAAVLYGVTRDTLRNHSEAFPNAVNL
jgi:hypothetical protein